VREREREIEREREKKDKRLWGNEKGGEDLL